MCLAFECLEIGYFSKKWKIENEFQIKNFFIKSFRDIRHLHLYLCSHQGLFCFSFWKDSSFYFFLFFDATSKRSAPSISFFIFVKFVQLNQSLNFQKKLIEVILCRNEIHFFFQLLSQNELSCLMQNAEILVLLVQCLRAMILNLVL